MKVISKPIEMIAWFKNKKIPEPLRFRLRNDDHSYSIIRINRVIDIREEKLAGIRSYVYHCQSLIDNVEKVYELKYIVEACQWILYKM